MTSEGHYLSPDKAFVTMSYINLFNLMLSYLPLAIFFTGQVRSLSHSIFPEFGILCVTDR